LPLHDAEIELGSALVIVDGWVSAVVLRQVVELLRGCGDTAFVPAVDLVELDEITEVLDLGVIKEVGL
jgi:hypothetical protein